MVKIGVVPSSRPMTWSQDTLTPTIDLDCAYLDLGSKNFIFESNNKNTSPVDNQLNIKSLKILESADTKYLMMLAPQFSHAIHDSLCIILKIHSMDPSGVFVLYEPSDRMEGVDKVYDYLQDFLKYKGIKYVFIAKEEVDVENNFSIKLKINRAVDVGVVVQKNNLNLSLEDHLSVSREVKTHIGSAEVVPYRKVYLSRSHIDRADYSDNNLDLVGFRDDVRMEREYLLAEFFKDNGYEVIIPEQKFKTFKEQLEYMREVKVLASVTSSGLMNSLFMEDQQFILEIVAELVTSDGHLNTTNQYMVSHYTQYAYLKKHIYLAVQSRRDPIEVINALEKVTSPYREIKND